MGHPRPLFRLFSVFFKQTMQFYNKSMWKNVMSIQYPAQGFEPTTFGTWVSSHNHKTRAPAQLLTFFLNPSSLPPSSLSFLFQFTWSISHSLLFPSLSLFLDAPSSSSYVLASTIFHLRINFWLSLYIFCLPPILILAYFLYESISDFTYSAFHPFSY